MYRSRGKGVPTKVSRWKFSIAINELLSTNYLMDFDHRCIERSNSTIRLTSLFVILMYTNLLR